MNKKERYVERIIMEVTHFSDHEIMLEDLEKWDRTLNEKFPGKYFVLFKEVV